METLPDELYLKIFIHLLPDKSCNINEFKNYFLVNKQWYKVLNDSQLKLHFSNQLTNEYEPLGQTQPIYTTYNDLIDLACYNYILLGYHPKLINIFGYNTLINLPVCQFKNADCIDNLCFNPVCNYKYHNISKYITNSVMRGIDNFNRHYLLFAYKNTETNEHYYEFIYNKLIHDKIIVTYSGIYNNTFIGMLSDNTFISSQTDPERELNVFSYNYIQKLINREKCTIPQWNDYYDIYKEDVNTPKGNIELI